MLLTICAGGKARTTPYTNLYIGYEKRINRMGPHLALGPCGLREIDTAKRQASRSTRRAGPKEAADPFLAAAAGADYVIALDEKGSVLTSRDFARRLAGLRDDGVKETAFLIGDADGLSPAVRQRADLTLSFGAMTWPHLMARVMLAEQIYRALCILNGHPYHHA